MPEEVTPPAAQATPEAASGASATPAPAAPAAQAQASAAAPGKATPAEPAKSASAEPAKSGAAEAKPSEAKPENQTEAKPAEGEKTVVPEKYDLKLPKDSRLAAAHVESLSAYAKEKGLSNEQAQALLDRENSAVSAYATEVEQKHEEIKSGWVDQAKGDKEIGGEAFKQNAELASRVVKRFGTEAFVKELNKTGLGNHPELLRVFTRIGKQMSDDQLVLPGAPAGTKSQKSLADRLYPASENKES